MRRKLLSFLLAFMLFGTLLSGIHVFKARADVASTDTLTVTFHYFRYDSNYTNWNIWSWPSGAEGRQVDFDGTDDFGVKVTYSVTGFQGQDGVGFIIKQGNWTDREPGGDRFIPLSAFNQSGHAEVWLVQADLNIYYDVNDADTQNKILNATFTSANDVQIRLTKEPTTDDLAGFKVTDENNANVAITSVTKRTGYKNDVIVKLTSPASFAKTYFVEATNFKGRFISMDNMFETDAFNDVFKYDGELGAIYSKTKTDFKLWAPLATKVVLNLYSQGSGDNKIKSVDMVLGDKGVWSHSESGDLNKTYYTYSVTNNNQTHTAVDPYARAAGVNGVRGMVIDLASTNPEGWEAQKRPVTNYTDAVIYEAHIRDLTIDSSSGVSNANKGKFLGLTEHGTKNAHGQSTALDHLIELGITELHILPMYDYFTVDESRPDVPQFNWGYDPLNYNVPEGSYSTDATKGEVRINELKQMVMTLHNNGIRVVMDVVYNHTSKSGDSDFEKIMPGYYYRKDVNGGFSNGSGCGNETASERAMFRKFMVDSVLYWAQEYKIDGFRFDLMGLHDIQTMNIIREELLKVNPNSMIYGEGWTGGTSPLSDSRKATLANVHRVPGIAMFNDVIRNGIKGGVNELTSTGFIQNTNNNIEAVKQGIAGGISHPEVNSSANWRTNDPTQVINYASAHDNYTLWDKIVGTTKTETHENRVKMNNLSAAIVLTAQGVSFIHAGEELLRTKPDGKGGFDENSYKSPDSTNSFKWNDKNEHIDVFNYYKGLIALRKAYKQFQMRDSLDVLENLSFITGLSGNVIGFRLTGQNFEGQNQTIYVFHNATKETVMANVEKLDYKILVQGDKAGIEAIDEFNGDTVEVKPISTTVIVQKVAAVDKGKGCKKSNNTASIVFLGSVALLGVLLLSKKEKLI